MARRAAALAVGGVLALGLGACGGDDETTSSSTTAVGASGASGLAGAAVTADSLVACLEGAGYEAATGDSVLGLDAEHTLVEMPLGDLEQGAAFVVFPSEDEAQTGEEDASALIGVSPSELTGNVVWGFDASADETPEDESAVEACLPS